MKRNRRILVYGVILLFFGAGVVLNVNVSGDGGEDIELDFSFDEPMIENITINTTIYDRVILSGLSNSNIPGEPCLPIQPVTVLIPQNYTVEDINVTVEGKTFLNGSFFVEPGQQSYPISYNWSNHTGPRTTSPNMTIYNSLEHYPNSTFQSFSIQKKRGYHILLLNLYPVRYIPKLGELYYYTDMHLTVSVTPVEPDLENYRNLSKDENLIKNLVDNPEDTASYNGGGSGSETYDYVVITDTTFANAFQNLRNWKETRGLYTNYTNLTTEIVFVDDIVENSSFWYDGYWGDNESFFNDTQCKIRNFIRYAYLELGTEYVLLGGDVEIIPARNFYVWHGPWKDNAPADLYYSCLDGNWNDDKDTKWGEEGEDDLFAEVYIGRASADSLDEVNNFVKKTIAYENATSKNENYLKKAVMIGANLNKWNEGGNLNDFVTEVIPQYTTKKIYNRDGTYSKDSILDEMENGTHIIDYCGHSTFYGFNYPYPITKYDVHGLSNNKYFLVCSGGCYSAAYDKDDAIGEDFITASGGAFAYIGNSRGGWGAYNLPFFNTLMNSNTTNVGKILQESKERLLEEEGYLFRWTYYALNLLGDPETQIKTNISAPTAHFKPFTGYQISPHIYNGTLELTGIAKKGNAENTTFSHYIIEYGHGLYPTIWYSTGMTLVDNGTNEITNSVLGYWNTSQVDDYYYTLRLTVFDNNTLIGRDWRVAIVANAFTIKNNDTGVYYNSLQKAVKESDIGDTFLVGNKTYYESIDLKDGMKLIGENQPGIDPTPSGRDYAIGAGSYTLISGFKLEKYIILFSNDGIAITNCDFTYDGISGDGSDNTTIVNCNFTNCGSSTILAAIRLLGKGESTINNCNFISNNYGIRVGGDSLITNCNFINNKGYGIYFGTDADTNIIYHNNFINNSPHINTYPINTSWDGGYPCGGNYWDDYNGSDNFLGPNQNISGSDGIGDIPYNISENSQDRYPLINPWGRITNISSTPDIVGYGFNVTIIADIIDTNETDIITVNILFPNYTVKKYLMNHTIGDTYEYMFNDTWRSGQYCYFIHVTDIANNTNISSGYSFTISAQCGVSIQTLEDEYGDNEYINLTDPPSDGDDWLEVSGDELIDFCYDGFLDEALDGINVWQCEESHTHYFVLYLEEIYLIKKVRGRSNTAGDPINVSIYVCEDSIENYPDITWGAAVTTGINTWQDTTDWVEVETAWKNGNFIKVEVTETEGNMLMWGDDPPFNIFDIYGDIPCLGDWFEVNSSNLDSCCGNLDSLKDALDGVDIWHCFSYHAHWFILDLGQTYRVSRVHGRSNSGYDPTDVDIYVSNNLEEWGNPVAEGINTWKNTSEWVEIYTTIKNGRYIKVVVHSTEGMQILLWGDFEEDYSTIFDVYVGHAPTISNPYPNNNEMGIPLSPMLNVTINDIDGDLMTLTWYSNISGGWVAFGSNNSVGNGIYHQTFTNASITRQWWYWKVNVSDGTHSVESTYRFYTGYQSKIDNTGLTDIRGYLLMQVHYFNETLQQWIVADDTVNEVALINSSEHLGLDTIFNGLVNTNDLSEFGSGIYRIYVAFRDPNGNILKSDDDTPMNASYEFNITTSPEITNVSNAPDTVGFGFNVTINADVIDDVSGVNIVNVSVTYPDESTGNFTMNHTSGDTYQYVFSDTWLVGQYNYTVWTVDNAYNTNISTGYSFNVSSQAIMSVCTMKDEYGSNETVNLTDPPSNPPPPDDPPSEPSPIGYELLDDGKVLHIWNKFDSYYFNTSSGIQFTNYYNEYWSHNVLMLGYYNNDKWNLIYRTDELNGFNKDIETDNETFVNATLWKDLTYSGYDFKLAIRYHLKVDDYDLTVIPYIKNLGVAIPFDISFGWEMKNIKIANITNDNYLRIFNGTDFEDILLNQTLDRSFTDMDYNTSINLICNNPPSPYLSRNLYLRWNHTLNYKVTVKSRANQYNAPTTLFIKVGTLAVGQEKYTKMHWLDADDWLGISSSEYDGHCGDDEEHTIWEALDGVDSWYHDTSHVHWLVVDVGQTYNIKKVRGRSNTNNDPIDVDIYVSDSKMVWGDAVATGISTWTDTNDWVEVDTTDKDGQYIKIEIIASEGYMPPSRTHWGGNRFEEYFTIFDAYGDVASNTAPTQSGQCIWNSTTMVNKSLNATNVDLTPTSFNVTIQDADGDNMNITIKTNESGTWTIVNQTSGSGLSNGIYSYYNTSWVDTYITKYWISFNVTDGTDWYNATYHFTTSYHFTITLNDPAEDGYIQWGDYLDSGFGADKPDEPPTITRFSSANQINFGLGSGYWHWYWWPGTSFQSGYWKKEWRAHKERGYVEWNISSLAGATLTANPILRYEGGRNYANDERINPITEGQPSVVSDGALFDYIGSGTAYVDPFIVEGDANEEVDLGVSARSNLQDAMDASQSWFAIGFQANEIGNMRLETNIEAEEADCTPPSALYVEYTLAYIQSKISNTGSTNCKGYLLMQVQFWNETVEEWVVADDTVNETSPRTININEQFGLDTIFNGLVNTNDLVSFGSGTYRVYVAFRDPDGNVLIDDNWVSMNASYEFDYMALQEITTMLKAWNWVSLPFNESMDKTDLLIKYNGIYYTWADAVTENLVDNTICGWNRETQQYDVVTVLEPGYGYWMYAYEECTLYVEKVDENYDEFITELKDTWNLIAIPYSQSINKLDLVVNYNDTDYTWADAVTEGIVDNTVNGWNRETQQYDVVTVLEPGYGYWMYAYYDCTLKI